MTNNPTQIILRSIYQNEKDLSILIGSPPTHSFQKNTTTLRNPYP